MPDIVIAEFMDEAAVRDGFAGLDAYYDPGYDPSLVDRLEELARFVVDARALVVRNRTQVRGPLPDGSAPWAGSASASTTSTFPPARPGASPCCP